VSARLVKLARNAAVLVGRPSVLTGLMVLVGLAGLALRIEHALTFDGPGRGSDYLAAMRGVRWVLEHGAPFDASAPLQVNHYPPLWFALSALMLKVGLPERSLAFIAVVGWGVRHLLLARLLTEAAADRRWSRLLALAADAFLPLSVLMSGKVNPEGLHATLFFVALYFLWRLERHLQEPAGPRWQDALWFGLFAGLAFLTKQTAGVLVIAAVMLLCWHVVAQRWGKGSASCRRNILRCTGIAALTLVLVTGWYLGNNLIRFGTPTPGPYSLNRLTSRIMAENPLVYAKPILQRRPLGWFLPLDFGYLKHPIGSFNHGVRPNFWVPLIAGAWGDYCNRGLCRLSGGSLSRAYWGGWLVSDRCVSWLRGFLLLGLVLSSCTAVATSVVLVRFLRTAGASGSLVVPVAPVLVLAFLMVFATVYPFDRGQAVVKPNYLLAATTPLAACCGLALAGMSRRGRTELVHGIASVALALAAFMLVFERFG